MSRNGAISGKGLEALTPGHPPLGDDMSWAGKNSLLGRGSRNWQTSGELAVVLQPRYVTYGGPSHQTGKPRGHSLILECSRKKVLGHRDREVTESPEMAAVPTF